MSACEVLTEGMILAGQHEQQPRGQKHKQQRLASQLLHVLLAPVHIWCPLAGCLLHFTAQLTMIFTRFCIVRCIRRPCRVGQH
jgi:hypothetical protein